MMQNEMEPVVIIVIIIIILLIILIITPIIIKHHTFLSEICHTDLKVRSTAAS